MKRFAIAVIVTACFLATASPSEAFRRWRKAPACAAPMYVQPAKVSDSVLILQGLKSITIYERAPDLPPGEVPRVPYIFPDPLGAPDASGIPGIFEGGNGGHRGHKTLPKKDAKNAKIGPEMLLKDEAKTPEVTVKIFTITNDETRITITGLTKFRNVDLSGDKMMTLKEGATKEILVAHRNMSPPSFVVILYNENRPILLTEPVYRAVLLYLPKDIKHSVTRMVDGIPR